MALACVANNLSHSAPPLPHAACSASLVALHMATRGLRDGEARMSYASGIHLQATYASTSYVWAASMLSPSGRCRALDSAADGYVRGETCITAVLAAADVAGGATPTGAAAVVVCGSAVNQDGHSSSLTAPNGPAQQEVIRAAAADSGIVPAAVLGLSMHGTGTSLGDPIEVGAALAVYGESQRGQPLALAASKSWVGHAEPAAGLAGLLFAHAAATHSVAPPLMHLRAVNPYVSSALEQQAAAQALLPKQGGALPVASEQHAPTWGASAFAFQGTNAHALLATVPAQGSAPRAVPAAAAPAWQHRRFYVLPEVHLLISAAAVDAGSPAARRVLFHAELAAARTAFLWDHQVLSKALFPGACVTGYPSCLSGRGRAALRGTAISPLPTASHALCHPLKAPDTLSFAARRCGL